MRKKFELGGNKPIYHQKKHTQKLFKLLQRKNKNQIKREYLNISVKRKEERKQKKN
jgi:hypothetical protein